MRPSTHGVATELFVIKGDPRCVGQAHPRHQGEKADEELGDGTIAALDLMKSHRLSFYVKLETSSLDKEPEPEIH
jgi:hypothetical protein